MPVGRVTRNQVIPVAAEASLWSQRPERAHLTTVNNDTAIKGEEGALEEKLSLLCSRVMGSDKEASSGQNFTGPQRPKVPSCLTSGTSDGKQHYPSLLSTDVPCRPIALVPSQTGQGLWSQNCGCF